MDTRALNYIMTHSADYQKPSQARSNLARILGKGKYIIVWMDSDSN